MTLLEINNRGTVSGYYTTAAGEIHSFFFENGVFRDLRHPDRASTGTSVLLANNGVMFNNWSVFSSQTAGIYDPETGHWTALPKVEGKNMNLAQRMNDGDMGVGIACEGDWLSISTAFPGREIQFGMRTNPPLTPARLRHGRWASTTAKRSSEVC